ncbi:unnamed protein product [Blepharisma stoltei]|uniref:Uncharacterized protein n=1 Tax=Blepharisma stoltei TaxID=1481888 RepID=A0AAU9K6Z4_9CILI|nr:unnamed protein product [Blepharisma stoltei]
MSERKKKSLTTISYKDALPHYHCRSEVTFGNLLTPRLKPRISLDKHRSPSSSFSTSEANSPNKKAASSFNDACSRTNKKEKHIFKELETIIERNSNLKTSLQKSSLEIELNKKSLTIERMQKEINEKNSKIFELENQINDMLKNKNFCEAQLSKGQSKKMEDYGAENMENTKNVYSNYEPQIVMDFLSNKEEQYKKKIDEVTAEKSKLQSKVNEMAKIIYNCQRENRILKEMRSHLTIITEQQENQVFLNLLIEENELLKEEIQSLSEKASEIPNNKVSELGNDLYIIMMELSQLLKITNAMYTEHKVDLVFLLGLTERKQLDTGNQWEKCRIMAKNIKSDMDELKKLISDVYAENCGEGCSVK